MNSNKAILVVSFGTSYKETRKKNIDKIEDDIRKAYKDFKVYRAFTSKMIIKKLKINDNIHIDTVEEALTRILDKGIKDIIIQPTHIINGMENDLMIEDLKKYRNDFNSIKIGSPLLTTDDDCDKLINILKDNFNYISKDEALVFMGHGSSNEANEMYEELNKKFKYHGLKNFFVGTLKGYPEIDLIIKSVKDLKSKKVYLIPLMIVAGNHAIKDMCSNKENSWKSLFEKEGFQVHCLVKGLGEYKDIRKIFVEHVKNSVNIKEIVP